MVARVATLSAGGKPRLTPLWFVYRDGRIYLNARADSPAARAIVANPAVVVLFSPDKARTSPAKVLKIKGKASFTAGGQFSAGLLLRFALKYHLSPGGVRNFFANLGTVSERIHYYRERAGEAGAIEIVVDSVEVIPAPA
jgi:hypothetical protein